MFKFNKYGQDYPKDFPPNHPKKFIGRISEEVIKESLKKIEVIEIHIKTPAKYNLLKRKDIIQSWEEANKKYMDYYCCPSCRDLLFPVEGKSNIFQCKNHFCKIEYVTNKVVEKLGKNYPEKTVKNLKKS